MLSARSKKPLPPCAALRHGDGGLALFNGTKEDLPSLIDLVLAQAGRARGASSSLSASGLYRLAAGKSLLFVDAGAPTPPGLDQFAHAGTLGFEFSVGKERLIVNCGAAPAVAGEWRDALRSTAAHSTLTIADVSSSEIRENGLGRRPANVQPTARISPAPPGSRPIMTAGPGSSAPFTTAASACPRAATSCTARTSSRPSSRSPSPSASICTPTSPPACNRITARCCCAPHGGQGFRLRAEGAPILIEESVYFGHAEPSRAEQIVLAGHQDGPQHVKWSITIGSDECCASSDRRRRIYRVAYRRRACRTRARGRAAR